MVNLTVVDDKGSSHTVFAVVNIASNNDNNSDSVPDDWGNAPNFILETLDDETYRLSDFFGKAVLLDFMGVDCVYCVYEMPIIKAISENYSRFDLAIISIDVYQYETEAYLRSFIDWFYSEFDINLDWIFGMDSDGTISNDYVKGGGVPKLVIIDQNGNIYYSFTGYTEYSAIANKLDEII
jgi:thiol-disulfide isomerase/thioredoxin